MVGAVQQREIDDFLKSLKVTAGSRFNSSKRLELIDRRLTALNSFSSAYIIIITVFPYIVNVDVSINKYLTLFTIVLSSILLASSLLQYAGSYAVKSEQFHRSALEMQELRREFRAKMVGMTSDEFIIISSKYNLILQKYSINHDDMDFYRYKLNNTEYYNVRGWDRFVLILRVFWAYRWPSFVILMLTVLVVLVLLYAWIGSSRCQS